MRADLLQIVSRSHAVYTSPLTCSRLWRGIDGPVVLLASCVNDVVGDADPGTHTEPTAGTDAWFTILLLVFPWLG
jgi:hypothetical protein